ncbi:uncharacterized protein TA04565 [Theileria annulata]|uniref:Uncharacterized protein n=1 Tax=Theileria annulata TaxID=5874 RepID=Q4UC00_THEAN|nr:uncharacterized protein TA04565 [Theileria annulata]CAI75651.1 hypothetical protein TA04565 [Theileria annulata]|eukprot:XP_955127.1 hypothetical protein TA04565 [Theileria annulata]
MAEKVSDRVGNLNTTDYDEKPEGGVSALSLLVGLFLGLANNFAEHFVFLLSYMSFKLLNGENSVPLNVFLFFFFFALGSVVFLFLSPLLSYFTVVSYVFEAFFFMLMLLSVKTFEEEPGRNVFTASVALLGLTHGVNKASTMGLVECTPFSNPRVVDLSKFLSGLLPLFLYVVFKFGVAEEDTFSKEELELFFVTVTSLALVLTLVGGLLSLWYSSTGAVKRYVERKKVENDTNPKFVPRHAGALFNGLLVPGLVFLALYFMKYTVFPTFFPLDASKKVDVGYKYLFLCLPGLMDGLSRLTFLYLFGKLNVDWGSLTPWKTLYMLVFDLLLVVYFAVLHNLQEEDFVLFEETFSLLFFMVFTLLHAATSDLVTLEFLSFRDDRERDKRDLETPSASNESGLSRASKRVTTFVFLNLLESVGSTLGALLTLLLFNLQPDK